jgi:hypothetical protein
MSSFLIFAIVLTVVYIIYYAIVIVQDLYGKPKEETRNAESFDVSDMAAEDESIAVSESDGGFSVGDNQYETSYEERQEEPTAEKKDDGISALDKIQAKIGDKMEATDVVSNDAVLGDELEKLMLAHGIQSKPGRPNIKIESSTDKL